ncbi:MAG: hypothetical protein GQ583_06185, partial [Methyloprofundus sp.]|nr:hypothetical protein [Methyloprofundus sp.]
MNRRMPDKKNYFSFLSDLSDSPMIRAGFYLIAVTTVILLCWFVFSLIDMEASTVFGVLALVLIPIVVLLAVFAGLEKITGISCLRGVEWVGKKTLLLFDRIIINIQKWRGIEPIDKQHVAPVDTAQRSEPVFKERAIETETYSHNVDAAVDDFEAIEARDPLF